MVYCNFQRCHWLRQVYPILVSANCCCYGLEMKLEMQQVGRKKTYTPNFFCDTTPIVHFIDRKKRVAFQYLLRRFCAIFVSSNEQQRTVVLVLAPYLHCYILS